MREVLRNLMFLAVFVILGVVFLCSCVATMESLHPVLGWRFDHADMG